MINTESVLYVTNILLKNLLTNSEMLDMIDMIDMIDIIDLIDVPYKCVIFCII